MEAINSGERTTSLINFIFVYIIILSVPLYLAFFAGTRRNAGGGSAGDGKEYESMAKSMTDLQTYTANMRAADEKLASMNSASPAGWQVWLDDAKKENQRFSDAIEKFRRIKFSGGRIPVQTSTCTFLDALHTERGTHIQYLERQRGIQNQNLSIDQLKEKNGQLQTEKATMQNQLNTLNALLAKQGSAGGGGAGGGGGQDAGVVADLNWQLRFKDADCNKKQADLLAAYNEATKRKKLYTSAKVNFQQIAQLARSSYILRQSATEKIREIDQTMSSL